MALSAEWPCYAPQPGHPTVAERKAFVDNAIPSALAAEASHGVPAPALIAMAIQESGYGYTRTALNANNLFGFKWVSTSGAGGRVAWVLACQPATDPNNRYVRFKNRADAFDYVAGRLAKSSYYRADTDAYKAAIANGADRVTAITAWIDAIADPYNANPALYRRTIGRLLNNPLAPADSLSPTENLYRLVPEQQQASPAAATKVHAGPHPAVRKLFQKGLDSGGRYMENECEDVALTDPLFAGVLAPYRGLPAKGVPVRNCRYPFAGGFARVLMANVDAEQLARWTLSACKQSDPDNLDRCLTVTSHNIWCGSNAQFAISGAVSEPAEICGAKAAGRKALITFRDGITVETLNAPYCSIKPYSEQEERASLFGKVSKVKKIGRIAMATRAMHCAAGCEVDVSATTTDASGRNAWLDAVRDSYVQAIGQDSYPLLAAWVASNKSRFDGYQGLDLTRFNCASYFNTK